IRRTALGAELAATPEPGVHFRVWAPNAKKVRVVVANPHSTGEPREVALVSEPGGYAAGFVGGVSAGARYRFRLDDGEPLPDPASRFQPEGTFGPSQVIDPGRFHWTDAAWTGLAPHEHIVYELHVGTFTRAGTWAAACKELAYLAQLGVTTIELMPIAEWAGTNNWGYDGVNLFAPHHPYGTPDDLRRFVDRAHVLGLAVILDVVWNHLGPSGNPLPAFSPDYFHRDKPNDWGDAINFEQPAVREYYTANAVYWVDEFHLDGLRVDATQAIHDATERHILKDIITRVREVAASRRLWIVGENEPQDARLLRDYGFDALWNDDFHHTARVAATGVVDGYLHDYTGSARELVSAIRHGFLYQGQAYPWQRNTRGTSTRGLERARFVQFLENHDQVANLAFGERLAELSDPATLRALTALLLLTPSIPMLFQGQETGSLRPWEFFCSHEGELADRVRRGRAQFVSQFQRLGTREALEARRDPCARSTFEACILDPGERDFARPITAFHRDLLHLRRESAAFTNDDVDAAVLSECAFLVRSYGAEPSGDRLLLVNLGATFHRAVVPEPLLAPPDGTGWRLCWSSEDPRYGGHGTPKPITVERLAIPGRATLVMMPDPAAQPHLDPPPPSGDQVPVDP
ncbi:MAG TPA: malto-oligosyltrehalose trehalohydrolase, partial [Kofleriaceae bacterium]|nr:malto-oligosyltrehalose trehalohydrolase [Kofleriaceae bacterium]